MNKIEEIIEAQNLALPLEYLKGSVRMGKNCKNDYKKILDAMIKFGKICFEAGRKGMIYSPEETGDYCWIYEDFLKEIEDE